MRQLAEIYLTEERKSGAREGTQGQHARGLPRRALESWWGEGVGAEFRKFSVTRDKSEI